MREIKFRGLCISAKKWIYGFYTCDKDLDKHRIEYFNYYTYEDGRQREYEVYGIYRESLGQYTGLKDKNDKEIYEGDIVRIINDSVDEEDGYFLVEFESESARYVLNGDGLVCDFDNTFGDECEVVGNIYDNPELLEQNNE